MARAQRNFAAEYDRRVAHKIVDRGLVIRGWQHDPMAPSGRRERKIEINNWTFEQALTYRHEQRNKGKESAKVYALSEVYERPILAGAQWDPYEDYDDPDYEFDEDNGTLSRVH